MIFTKKYIEKECINEVCPQLSRAKEEQSKSSITSNTYLSHNHKIVNAFLDLGITRTDVEQLPIAIHYIFAEALEHSRLTPPIECGQKAYELLLRPELLAHFTVDSDTYGKT